MARRAQLGGRRLVAAAQPLLRLGAESALGKRRDVVAQRGAGTCRPFSPTARRSSRAGRRPSPRPPHRSPRPGSSPAGCRSGLPPCGPVRGRRSGRRRPRARWRRPPGRSAPGARRAVPTVPARPASSGQDGRDPASEDGVGGRNVGRDLAAKQLEQLGRELHDAGLPAAERQFPRATLGVFENRAGGAPGSKRTSQIAVLVGALRERKELVICPRRGRPADDGHGQRTAVERGRVLAEPRRDAVEGQRLNESERPSVVGEVRENSHLAPCSFAHDDVVAAARPRTMLRKPSSLALKPGAERAASM